MRTVERSLAFGQGRSGNTSHDWSKLRPENYDEKRMDEVACGCWRLVNEPHYCYRAQRCLKERR